MQSLWREYFQVSLAEVTDPRHGVEKVFPVYEVEIGGTPHRFAGGEFSNGVFGVYLPEE